MITSTVPTLFLIWTIRVTGKGFHSSNAMKPLPFQKSVSHSKNSCCAKSQYEYKAITILLYFANAARPALHWLGRLEQHVASHPIIVARYLSPAHYHYSVRVIWWDHKIHRFHVAGRPTPYDPSLICLVAVNDGSSLQHGATLP